MKFHKLFGVKRDELGSLLHESLQKYCKSKPTSIVWNLVLLKEMEKAWESYLDLVWERMEKMQPLTKGQLPLLMNGSFLQDCVEGIKWGNPKRNIFKCAFQLFDANDWNGMANLLYKRIKL